MVWNKSFKSNVTNEYNNRISSAATAVGPDVTVRPCSFETACGWIVAAWKVISKETIARYFVTCGISTAFDGSQDLDIHCLKLPDFNGSLAQLQLCRQQCEDDDILADPLLNPADVEPFDDDLPMPDDLIVHLF